MTTYKWGPGSQPPIGAQVVGEEIEAIREDNGGYFKPQNIVDKARPKGAPLHGAFEWNNKIAGEAHRVEQAKSLIRSIVFVRQEEAPIKVRAFVSVEVDDGHRYTSSTFAFSRAELRKQVLQNAWRELQQFHKKYQDLQEFSGVRAAIDQAGPEINAA